MSVLIVDGLSNCTGREEILNRIKSKCPYETRKLTNGMEISSTDHKSTSGPWTDSDTCRETGVTLEVYDRRGLMELSIYMGVSKVSKRYMGG